MGIGNSEPEKKNVMIEAEVGEMQGPKSRKATGL